MLSKYDGSPAPDDGCLYDFGINEDCFTLPLPPPESASANDPIPVTVDGVLLAAGAETVGSGVLAAAGGAEKESGDAVLTLSKYDGRPAPDDCLYDFGMKEDGFTFPVPPPDSASANEPISVPADGDDASDFGGADELVFLVLT